VNEQQTQTATDQGYRSERKNGLLFHRCATDLSRE
jgi:hypothetical protein